MVLAVGAESHCLWSWVGQEDLRVPGIQSGSDQGSLATEFRRECAVCGRLPLSMSLASPRLHDHGFLTSWSRTAGTATTGQFAWLRQ